MATITQPWTISNTTGTTGVKFRYRLSTASTWTSVVLAANIRTYTFTGENDRIYDMQTVNLNGSDNPASLIVQNIGFSNPTPLLSPTNTTISMTFNNASEDIDSYTCSVAEFDTPGSAISSVVLHTSTYPEIMSTTLYGLSPLTKYSLTIQPAANQFTEIFTYTFTTEELATCAAPSLTTATFI